MSDQWQRDSWDRCCQEYFPSNRHTKDVFMAFHYLNKKFSKEEPKEWHIDRKKGISKEIRPMTKEERERAKEREEANNGKQCQSTSGMSVC